MKTLTSYQVQKLAAEISTLKGAQLQEVKQTDSLLLLGLYLQSSLHWLVFDTNPQSPCVVRLSRWQEIVNFKETKKPISLFLKSHGLDQRLVAATAPADWGRVLNLQFSNGLELQARLFPRGPNLIVTHSSKEVAWSKPQPLKPVENQMIDDESFNWDLFSAMWLDDKNKILDGQTKTTGDARQQQEHKLKKSIQKLCEDIEAKQKLNWAQAGEYLKLVQNLKAANDPQFEARIDRKKSFAWNMSNCFQKAKDTKSKIEKAKQRLADLHHQLENLQSGAEIQTSIRAEPKSLLQSSEAKGRTFDFAEGVRLYVGKSAIDNLKLLREARPWYYWLHLRDEPGAHAILSRNKNQNLADALMHSAAQQLIQTTYGEKHIQYKGQKIPVLVAECRFVRPIKGDRLGRVNYSDERTILHLYT